MPPSALARKLQIKPGYRILIQNAPDGFADALQPLPDAVELSEDTGAVHDLVQFFVHNTTELATRFAAGRAALKTDGVFWISYPNAAAKVPTDLSRDRGWDIVAAAGLRTVSLVSIDRTWSALRFRPRELVGR